MIAAHDTPLPPWLVCEHALIADFLTRPSVYPQVARIVGDGDSAFQDRPSGALYRVFGQLDAEEEPLTAIAAWVRLSAHEDTLALDTLEEIAKDAGSRACGNHERAAVRRSEEIAYELRLNHIEDRAVRTRAKGIVDARDVKLSIDRSRGRVHVKVTAMQANDVLAVETPNW